MLPSIPRLPWSRPQLAITRLIARSGIPERKPRPFLSKRAYVVSVHLNHANSGEWELWTEFEKYTKTGAWPVGRSRHVRPRVEFPVFETRVPSTGSISMFLGPLSMPLRTMQDCVRSNASTAFMELPTLFSTT